VGVRDEVGAAFLGQFLPFGAQLGFDACADRFRERAVSRAAPFLS